MALMQCCLAAVVMVQLLALTATQQSRRLVIFTVATERTDGYNRFLRSIQLHGLELVTLGMGEKWEGGDMNYPGGGWKVNLLKNALEKRKEDSGNVIMMFTDSYDVIFTSGKESLLAQYEKLGGGILFGAENYCWPDASLKSQYPVVETGMRFLNSGGFIGELSQVADMLASGGQLANTDDDQLFYTKIFLDKELRRRFSLKLDHRAELFQNLNGEAENVELKFAGNVPYVKNLLYETLPMVIHGNGPSKLLLNTLGNYLAGNWDLKEGCIDCWRDVQDFANLIEPPHVLLAIFIEKATPFMAEFWDKVAALDYDKTAIDLVIHNNVAFHESQASEFAAHWSQASGGYHSVELISHKDEIAEAAARRRALAKCREVKCDYLLVLDSDVQLDNPHTLKLLIEQNRALLAPMLIRPYTAWSNFWGTLSSDGFYARSLDYMELVNNNRRGLWNVPYVASCYLMAGQLVEELGLDIYSHKGLDPDMALAANVRESGHFLYVSNRLNFGHLVNNENFPTSHLNNELWEMERNRFDWEARYLHKNYSQNLDLSIDPAEPCPDVYWFPVFTERFCDEFVGEAENFGQWSDGSNKDSRLQGGYEAVPTRDIHMNQIGYDTEWLYILDFYIRPLQERVFVGYFHQPPRSLMNFVVRYRPDEQPNLRPHHDSSTYTINVALNTVDKDYQGGGCRFLRYDCRVTDTKKGWILMHPGRLTHYHEGLTVTSGTRYIMISFVDP